MAGINRTGKPQPTDYYLGRGAIYMAAINTATGKPLGFRHVGNATAFDLNVTTDKLEHQNSRTGIRSVDREIILTQKVGVKITLDEATNFDNLALFLSGQAAKDVANYATSNSVTDQQIATAAYKTFSYELRGSAGDRLYDILATALTVKSGATLGGASTLTRDVDYEVDAVFGTIFLIAGGAHVEGNALWFSYVSQGTEKPVDQVTMLTQSKQSVFVRFKAINPAASDKKTLVDLHSVSLSADGDLSLISEDFATLTLSGVAERNELGYPTAPTGRIYTHEDA